MKAEVTQLRPYQSTVHMIRDFADCVERGEVSGDHVVCVALDPRKGTVSAYAWGPRSQSAFESAGMLAAAQHLIFEAG